MAVKFIFLNLRAGCEPFKMLLCSEGVFFYSVTIVAGLFRLLILLTKGGWMHKKQGLAKTQVPEYYLNRERVEIFYANQERPCCDRPPRYLCSSKRRSGYDGDKKA